MCPRQKLLIFFLAVAWTSPLAAQPVTIRFTVQSELATELTSVTDLYAETTHGPYNLKEISTMNFSHFAPDSVTMEKLRSHGIRIYLKGKYLKPKVNLKPKVMKPETNKEEEVTVRALRDDSIWMKKNRYYQGHAPMTAVEILAVLEGNLASRSEALQAKSDFNGAQIIGFVSGVLIGWPIGQAIGGKQEPQWGLAAGGVALLVAGAIPLENKFHQHMNNAIRIFNSQARPAGKTGLSLHFVPSPVGGTLVVTF